MKLYCPLRETEHGPGTMCECIKESCAWYSLDAADCSLKAMAYLLALFIEGASN